MFTQAALLQTLDEQMAQEPGLTEVEAFNGALKTAHDEDISAWAGAIAQSIPRVRPVPLLQLQQSLEMP